MNYTALVDKIRAGERLNEDEGLYLFEKMDLRELGQLADERNQKINHRNVFFNINRHINPTNICVLSCKFCSFSRKPGDEGAYAYSIEEILEKAGNAVAQNATEVHMVGGLHPRWSFDHYLQMISAIRQKFPSLHIKAFTAVELDWFAKKTRSSIKEVLEKLVQAGLGSIPGGGAEIFHPQIRDQICETKVSAEQWIETHRTAHHLGLHSNATMLYGHIENYEHRIDHMRRLRELQDETGKFNAFIPLAFQPHDNDMGISRYTFGVEDLKTIAVARLFLDNFKHIKSYWVMMGQDIAQLGLEFGANDLDGTVVEEKISRMAGGRSGMVMTQEYLQAIIANTNHECVERNTVYQAIKHYPKINIGRRPDAWTHLLNLGLNELSNKIARKSLQIQPLSSLKNQVAITLKATEHLSLDFVDLFDQIQQLNSDESLLIHAQEKISIAAFLRALSCIKITKPDSLIAIDFKSLPCLSPSSSGQASNQDPRFKTLGLYEHFGVDALILENEDYLKYKDLIEAEIAGDFLRSQPYNRNSESNFGKTDLGTEVRG